MIHEKINRHCVQLSSSYPETPCVIIVDLDGTLVNCNTFPRWVFFSLKRCVLERRFCLFFELLRIIFLRKLFFYLSHVEFKERVNNLPYPNNWASLFLKEINNQFSLATIDSIVSYRPDYIILSTAAPHCYVRGFLNFPLIKFDALLCSSGGDVGFVDNIGKAKMVNTVHHLKYKNLTSAQVVFYTDHIDDLPLAKYSSIVHLCNPKGNAIKLYNRSGIDFKIVRDIK